MSAIEVFHYVDRDVRALTIDGEPWFVLSDLARVLGIVDVPRLNSRLDDGVRRTHPIEDRMGRSQMTTIVNEAGMYEVVIRSDKPNAVEFRRWITTEVLPSIRRTGTYAVPESREQLLARAVIEANTAITEAHQQIEALTPKAEAWEEIADAGTDFAVRDVAPMLSRAGIETGPQRLFETLHGLGWIYRGERNRWAPYARAVDAGYLKLRAMPPYRDRDTGELVPSAPQVRVPPRGVERLRIRLGAIAIPN